MFSHEHRRPLYAFGVVALVAVMVLGNGIRAQAVDALVAAGAPQPLIGAIAPDMVLGETLTEVVSEPTAAAQRQPAKKSAVVERVPVGAAAAVMTVRSDVLVAVGSKPRASKPKSAKSKPAKSKQARASGVARAASRAPRPSARPEESRSPQVRVSRADQGEGRDWGHHEVKRFSQHDRGHGKFRARSLDTRHAKGHAKGHSKHGKHHGKARGHSRR